MIEQAFTIRIFNTKSENKWAADSEHINTYVAHRQAAWRLWYTMHHVVGLPDTHIEVRNMYGKLCDPSKGVLGMD